jgi:hypothetical protein
MGSSSTAEAIVPGDLPSPGAEDLGDELSSTVEVPPVEDVASVGGAFGEGVLSTEAADVEVESVVGPVRDEPGHSTSAIVGGADDADPRTESTADNLHQRSPVSGPGPAAGDPEAARLWATLGAACERRGMRDTLAWVNTATNQHFKQGEAHLVTAEELAVAINALPVMEAMQS